MPYSMFIPIKINGEDECGCGILSRNQKTAPKLKKTVEEHQPFVI